MYSNNIPKFQESLIILNAYSGNLLNAPRMISKEVDWFGFMAYQPLSDI